MPKRTINLTFPSGTDLPEKDIAAYKLFLSWLIKKIDIQHPKVSVVLTDKSRKLGALSIHKFTEGFKDIGVRWEGRAMIDILRSLAKEFQHLKQYEKEGPWEGIDWAKEGDAASVSGQLIKKFMADHNECRWIYKY